MKTGAKAMVRMEMWASPSSGKTLTDLVLELEDQGLDVQRVDWSGRRVLVAHYEPSNGG